MQLAEAECGVVVRCNYFSNAVAFWHPYVVWLATRHIGWVLLAPLVDIIEIIV